MIRNRLISSEGTPSDREALRGAADLPAGQRGARAKALAALRGPPRSPSAQAPRPAPPALRHELRPGDREGIREILHATGFFYPAEVEVALELVDDRLEWGPESDYYFVFAEDGGRTLGYTCYGPIACTASSVDLFWIAVRPDCQGRGIGRILLAETERLAAAAGGTRLYIETSNRPLYAPSRVFYDRCGYVLASLLEDFYGPGDDKATYCKVLEAPGKRRKGSRKKPSRNSGAGRGGTAEKSQISKK